MNQGKNFVISGPSGVGKGTIVRALLQNPELNLVWGTTYTTRPPRPSDAAENHYRHVGGQQFKKLKQSGKIFESNFFNGNWYGSSKKLIDEIITAGKNVIVELDVNGGLAYQKTFPDATLIFISAPLNDIRQRLESRRQNTAKQIAERMKTAQKELEIAKQYDHIIENPQNNPGRAIKATQEIILNNL